MQQRVQILRLGHRPQRDIRLTSHVCLISRAFGAEKIIIASNKDENVEKTILGVNRTWGGNFTVEFNPKWRSVIKSWHESGGEVIHLTMYGLPVDETIQSIGKSKKPKLIVVGAEKVPGEVYQLADYNIAIGNQPHSEAAALAVLLHELFEGKELGQEFPGAQRKIIPQEHGKKVVQNQ